MKEVHGVLAEFDDAEELLEGTRRMRSRGYRAMDAFSPFPVEGLAEAVGFTRNRIPLLVLLGGIFGGLLGYGLQYYSAVIDYPFNIGGRPPHSWPAFILVTFELTVLFAALAGFAGTWLLSGLPRYYHPVFNVTAFDTATRDRFFLLVKAEDPLFDSGETSRVLEDLGASRVWEVEP